MSARMTTDRHTLQIDLWTGGDAPRVAIDSRRPVHASRVFNRRAVADVAALLPRLFSVCGIAQAQAARTALALATGGDPVDENAGGGPLLLMETAREHLWRVLIDWPAFLGEPVSKASVTAMHSLLPRLREAGSESAAMAGARSLDDLLRQAVFEMPAADWLALGDRDALEAWCQDTDTAAARLLRQVFFSGWESVGRTTPRYLPSLSAADLDRRLSDGGADAFVERPDWQGRACETTPLSRVRDEALVAHLASEFGTGLLTRLVALLAELAELPRRLRRSEESPTVEGAGAAGDDRMPANVGIAQVDAARGRLVHRAVVDGDRVESYQIVAPTEWNFHPCGVLADSLCALNAPDREELRQQAALLAMTIDPCVDFSVRVH